MILPTLKQRRVMKCHARVHCETCRSSEAFRLSVSGLPYFDCPFDLQEDERPPKLPGDVFHEILKQKYAIKPCAACLTVIETMNQQGKAYCLKAKKEILEDIWTRKSDIKGWRNLAAKLPGSKTLALLELGHLFDRAMRESA